MLFAAGQMAGPWPSGRLADHFGAAAILGWTTALCGAGAVVAAAFVRRAGVGQREGAAVTGR